MVLMSSPFNFFFFLILYAQFLQQLSFGYLNVYILNCSQQH